MGSSKRRAKRAIQKAAQQIVQRAGPEPESGPAVLVGPRVEIQSYTGSMIPPEFAAMWEQVLPGSAERILSQVERQQAHRHGLENTVVTAQAKSVPRGQWFALILGLGALVFAGWALYIGKDGFAVGGIVTAAGFLIGNFINQGRRTDQDTAAKRQRAGR